MSMTWLVVFILNSLSEMKVLVNKEETIPPDKKLNCVRLYISPVQGVGVGSRLTVPRLDF